MVFRPSLEKKLEYLKACGLFEGVDVAVLNYMAQNAVGDEIKETDRFYVQGETSQHFLILVQGVAHVVHYDLHHDPGREEPRHLYFRKVYEQLGLLMCLTGAEHYGTTIALTDLEVLRIERPYLMWAMSASEELIENLGVSMNERIGDLLDRINSLSLNLNSLYENKSSSPKKDAQRLKLATFLFDLSVALDAAVQSSSGRSDAKRFTAQDGVPIKLGDLPGHLYIAKETCQEITTEFKDRGILGDTRGRIKLLMPRTDWFEKY